MRATSSIAFTIAAVVASIFAATPADATCKRFGFTVNDYGKEGPTNDAKNLLDKHVAEWASKSGVTDYQIGKKSVSCELFLDVILFDEHTCTATANVCWGPSLKKSDGDQAAAEEEATGGVPHPVSKAAALGIEAQSQQAASAGEEAPAEEAAAAVDDGPPVPIVEQAVAEETPPAQHAAEQHEVETVHTPAAAAGAGALVETGALADKKNEPAASMSAQTDAPMPDGRDRAAAAAAAASAAAAAERAAAAAETAANAAKEAAAAAVAASAASKGPATVPPLDQASVPKSSQSQ
jgi:hypothetical protein